MKKAMLKRILCLALAVTMLFGSAVTVFAADYIKMRDADQVIGSPFAVDNMFPGDSYTKDFKLKLSQRGPITLHFDAIPVGESPVLSAGLNISVYVVEKGLMLYNGLVKDMPSSVSIDLGARERNLTYRITVSLPTEAGNEYQAKRLVLDFKWWYLEQSQPDYPDHPGTGDSESVKIHAEKRVNGKEIEGKEFEFVLADKNGKVIETVNNDKSDIEFSSLTFNSAGVYTYYIYENKGNNSNINYDTAKFEVIITVTDTRNGLVSYIDYEKGDKEYEYLPRFNNSTKDGSDYNPNTGFDPVITAVAGGVVLCGMFAVIVIVKRRKKGGEANG